MSNLILVILNNLDGRKTYIVSFIAALLAVCQAFGWTPLTNDQVIAIETALFALIAMFMRAGINKV